MDATAIESALAAAESALEEGRGLAGTGFWRAVAEVKADRDLVDRFAERIAAIDRTAFETWAMVTGSITRGTWLMLTVTAVGLVLVGLSYPLEGFAAVVVFYAGLGLLLVTTHGLGHLLVGRVLGIRFTHWFLGPPSFPMTGGVKIDYASYLRTPPQRRAWMHAAGALATKILPFLLLGAAIAADLATWSVWLLAIIGVAVVLTDVVWSTKRSDWRRFRREMAFAGRP